MNVVTVCVLTVSDRASRGETEDLGGPRTEAAAVKYIKNAKVVGSAVVPDEQDQIKKQLLKWCDQRDPPNVIFTTGGTGFASRDVTPEATLEVIQKRCNGMETAITVKSLEITPFAVLSRPVVGIRDCTLIITLPGKPKGAEECVSFVGDSIPHAVGLITAPTGEAARQHIPSASVCDNE